MTHEKALYNYLLENAAKIEEEGKVVYRLDKGELFKVYLSKDHSFMVCERENGTDTSKDYFFDDRSDQGFDPITAKEALELLKGGES